MILVEFYQLSPNNNQVRKRYYPFSSGNTSLMLILEHMPFFQGYRIGPLIFIPDSHSINLLCEVLIIVRDTEAGTW